MDAGHGHTEPLDPHAAAREAMVRVQTGDAQAFQELYDAHTDVVYSVAVSLLKDEPDAQDVMQEVFLKVWNASELYDPVFGKVVAWLITITRHRCLNRLRSGQRRSAAHLASAAEEEGPGAFAADSVELLLRKEAAVAVHNALAALPPAHSEAIRLTFLHGLTHEETALKLSAPLGTVKARIRRGLARLKTELHFIR